MIKVYGFEGCPKCKELKEILTKKKIDFVEIMDKTETMRIGSRYMILSAPIVVVDDYVNMKGRVITKAFNFADYIKYLER